MKKRLSMWGIVVVLTILLCACSTDNPANTSEKATPPSGASQNTETTVGENRLSFIDHKNGVEVKAEGVLSGKIVVPEEYDGKAVLRVASNGFKDQTEITELILPDSLLEIGNNAFSGCKQLQTLAIPNSVTSLGSGAFSHLTALKELSLPGSVKTMNDHLIEDCAIERLVFPEGVEELTMECVIDCPNLHVISLPSTIKKIKAVFHNCPIDTLEVADLTSYCMCEGHMQWSIKHFVVNGETVTDLVLPEGLQKIVFKNAFQEMNFRSVVLPESLKYIGEDAFCATNIDHIKLPENLEEIGISAFWGCPIKEIHFPRSLKYIRSGAFADTLLEKVEVPEGLKKIENGVFLGTMIEEITVPEGITEIGNETFKGCPLKKVVLPHSLNKIGEAAFEDTLLEEIVLPEGIVEIGKKAFRNCPLKTVNYPGSLRKIDNFAFENTLLEEAILPEGLECIGRETFATKTMKVIELPVTLKEFFPFQTAPNLEKMIYRGTAEDLRSVDKCFWKTELKLVGMTWVSEEIIEFLTDEDPLPGYFVFASENGSD